MFPPTHPFSFEGEGNGDQRWEWSNGGDHSEPWSPETSTVCVMFTIVGDPAGVRVGRERQRQFVSGHARAAVETAVDVPDHGDALSADREETINTNRGGTVLYCTLINYVQ